jgi:hypothetical protein
VGVGGQSQNSGASDLTSVTVPGACLPQKFDFLTGVSHDAPEPNWLGEFQLGLASFKPADSQPNASQSRVGAVSFRLAAGHRWTPWSENAVTWLTPWRLFVGGSLDQSFRWAKAGARALGAQTALSLGPTAWAMRSFRPTGPLFSFRETGIALNLPISGVLTGGQLGAQARLYAEWNLAGILIKENAVSFALRSEFECAYLRWTSPDSTSTAAWSFWLAPTVTF